MGSSFGFGKVLDIDFDAAVEKVTSELATEGFGVLTEIDVAATMKKKLDKDMRPYRILGACNPKLAYEAISNIPDIGLLLPCNVVVREDDAGRTVIEFMDPESVLSLAGGAELKRLATEVKSRLERVADRL